MADGFRRRQRRLRKGLRSTVLGERSDRHTTSDSGPPPRAYPRGLLIVMFEVVWALRRRRSSWVREGSVESFLHCFPARICNTQRGPAWYWPAEARRLETAWSIQTGHGTPCPYNLSLRKTPKNEKFRRHISADDQRTIDNMNRPQLDMAVSVGPRHDNEQPIDRENTKLFFSRASIFKVQVSEIA
jgi:hypothetical protein